MQKNFTEELRWRGMVHDMTPGVEEELEKGVAAGYIGFDPTADSLHIGSLVQIMTLVHFQRAGHKPIALVGGATGMVGDPSGKSAERNLLSADEINSNLEGIKRQLSKFLEFGVGDNAAEIVNNYDWFEHFSFLDFIRDVGKHITVNYMMAKESVKKRIEGENGMSFTEFSYQLVQGYDFYQLYAHKNCKLQLGGSDQWGNMVTGTELIRRKAGGNAYAITTPLIKKADGSKFGKTEAGNVWLDPERTSPYEFYQYWLNASDEDALSYLKIFTLLNEAEIEQLRSAHAQAPHLRKLQQALAKDVTTRVHSAKDYEDAVSASKILFGRSTSEELVAIDEKTLLSVFKGVPQTELTKADLDNATDVATLLSDTVNGLVFHSKGEARRMIKGGGVSINETRIADASQAVDFSLLKNRYLLVRKGKKNYYLIKVIS